MITKSVNHWKAQGHRPEEKYCKSIIKECKDLEDLNYWEIKIIRDWNCVEREDCYKRTDEHNKNLKAVQFKKSIKNIVDKAENYLPKYDFNVEWKSEVKEQIVSMFINDGKNMVEIHKTVHKNPEYIKRFLINEVKDNLETKKRFLEVYKG